FDLLRVLVEGHGHVFSKEELLEKVWPDAYVDENNLAQNVSLLRKALGDSSESRYIETVPKRGYRFVAAVRTPPAAIEIIAPAASAAIEPEHADAVVISRRTHTHVVRHDEIEEDAPAETVTPSAARTFDVSHVRADSGGTALLALPPRVRRPLVRRAFIVAACMLVLVALLAVWLVRSSRPLASPAEVKSLAILPFKELGAGQAQQGAEADYLGLGMADALITKFSNTRQIVARPTSAVRKYALEGQTDPAAAGRELGVDAVLTGNIQRAGE